MPSFFSLFNLPLSMLVSFIPLWNDTCYKLSVAVCPTSCIVSCINIFRETKNACTFRKGLKSSGRPYCSTPVNLLNGIFLHCWGTAGTTAYQCTHRTAATEGRSACLDVYECIIHAWGVHFFGGYGVVQVSQFILDSQWPVLPSVCR